MFLSLARMVCCVVVAWVVVCVMYCSYSVGALIMVALCQLKMVWV
jgi:hypothetical protein